MKINANVYNHLSSSLVPRKRSTTHKSSELKAVYCSITKYNRNSPLYLLSLSESKQEHMINIKEAALTLRDVAESFSKPDSAIYSKKVLHSDNEASITGAFKSHNTRTLPNELKIRIASLAREQINVGNYVRSSEHSLIAKEHTFTLETINTNAHFSISVTSSDTNIDVQKKLAQYINNRNLGINVSVLTEDSSSALMLSSIETGVPATDDGLYFSIKKDSQGQNLVDVFGLAQTTEFPSNSSFYINDEKHSSTSNHISINQAIELDFHEPTAEPVTISFVPDINSALHQIDMFADAYNSLIDMSKADKKVNLGSRSLFNDISGIVTNHKTALERAGLKIDDTNRIVKDNSLLIESLRNGGLSELFGDTSKLRDDIYQATDRLTLDPAAYINKLIVTYPNAQNKLNSTYTQSRYSGLMYNNYA